MTLTELLNHLVINGLADLPLYHRGETLPLECWRDIIDESERSSLDNVDEREAVLQTTGTAQLLHITLITPPSPKGPGFHSVAFSTPTAVPDILQRFNVARRY